MRARDVIGIIFILLGLSALIGISLGRFIGPLILIYIGWLILTRRSRHSYSERTQSTSQNSIDEVFVFSGTKRRLDSQDFNGGKVVAIFGGVDLDFSEVKTKKKTINIELVTIFGGAKIKVPKDWKVVSEAVGVFGGVDNKASEQQKAVVLHVNGVAIFGGIEIIN